MILARLIFTKTQIILNKSRLRRVWPINLCIGALSINSTCPLRFTKIQSRVRFNYKSTFGEKKITSISAKVEENSSTHIVTWHASHTRCLKNHLVCISCIVSHSSLNCQANSLWIINYSELSFTTLLSYFDVLFNNLKVSSKTLNITEKEKAREVWGKRRLRKVRRMVRVHPWSWLSQKLLRQPNKS